MLNRSGWVATKKQQGTLARDGKIARFAFLGAAIEAEIDGRLEYRQPIFPAKELRVPR